MDWIVICGTVEKQFIYSNCSIKFSWKFHARKSLEPTEIMQSIRKTDCAAIGIFLNRISYCRCRSGINEGLKQRK